jgi:hypothetical protein
VDTAERCFEVDTAERCFEVDTAERCFRQEFYITVLLKDRNCQ